MKNLLATAANNNFSSDGSLRLVQDNARGHHEVEQPEQQQASCEEGLSHVQRRWSNPRESVASSPSDSNSMNQSSSAVAATNTMLAPPKRVRSRNEFINKALNEDAPRLPLRSVTPDMSLVEYGLLKKSGGRQRPRSNSLQSALGPLDPTGRRASKSSSSTKKAGSRKSLATIIDTIEQSLSAARTA